MALYAIGDLHLSLNSDKSMEVFGPAWENYTERIRASLSQLTAEDVLVLAGDTSWGMSLEESVEDFRFLDAVSLQKISHQGQPRLLVGHRRQVPRLLRGQRLHHAGTAAQQLLFLRQSRRLRHPGLVFGRGTEAPQRQGAEPGAAAAGDFAEGGGGEAHLLLPPLSAAVSGLPVPGDPVHAGNLPGESCAATAISTGR